MPEVLKGSSEVSPGLVCKNWGQDGAGSIRMDPTFYLTLKMCP